MVFDCEQLAGFAELNFYLIDETSNWPVVVTDQNSADILFTPFEIDVDAKIIDDSINVDVNPRQSAEGTIYPVLASFRISSRSESLEQLLEQYQNKPGILRGDLNTGFRKIYGTNEEPLYMTYRIEEGQKPGDTASASITIKGETRNRPVFYTQNRQRINTVLF